MSFRLGRFPASERDPAPPPSPASLRPEPRPPGRLDEPEISSQAGGGRNAGPASAPGIKVDIRNVEFFYGKFKALHGVSLPLYDRRVTAFIVPSG
jgi:hypothetical protein